MGVLRSHGKGDPPYVADRKQKSLRESLGNLGETLSPAGKELDPRPCDPLGRAVCVTEGRGQQ